MTQPVAIDARLLRAVLSTELELSLGRELMARIASVTAPGRGTLSLAGVLLEAELPAHVRAGDELKLAVRELTPERVVLAVVDERQSQDAIGATPAYVQLPGGARLRVSERHRRAAGTHGGQEEAHSLTLRYETETLGALELRFLLTAGSLALSVEVSAAVLELLSQRSGELERALTHAVARPVRVSFDARRDPVEVYA